MLQFSRFVGVRLFFAIVTLLIVTFIVFTLMELNQVQYSERCWAFKPLDQHYVVRWLDWVKNVFLHGDFGETCILRMRINTLLGSKFWISLGICLASLVLAYLIAIPVGLYSASTNTRSLNTFLRVFSYFGLAVPNFLFALIILLVWSNLFGETLIGLFSREYHGAEWSLDKFVDFLSHAWFLVIVLGWSATAFAVLSVRALVADEYGKYYVTAARARGLYGRRLLCAIRRAMPWARLSIP